jgi:solute carrier family 35, member E1
MNVTEFFNNFLSMDIASTTAFWCAGSVANNILTKRALRICPYPFTLCLVGLLVQTIAARVSMGGEKRTSLFEWRTVLPISISVASSFLFHRVALMYGSVGLTITVKSMSTVFVALLSRRYLGETLSISSTIALVLIVLGIVVASVSDVKFNWICFLAAAMSGLSVSLKVILNKLALNRITSSKKEMYYNTMFVASVLVLPVCLFLEHDAVLHIKGSSDAATSVLLSGSGLAWMEIGSYVLIALVTPVTHAVCNGIRSLVVIVAGALYFQTPMPPQKILGVGIVLCGSLLYSLSKIAVSTKAVNAKKTK